MAGTTGRGYVHQTIDDSRGGEPGQPNQSAQVDLMTHPDWCDPSQCSHTEHRSTPIIIDPVTVGLYAEAATPEKIMVEIRCRASIVPPRVAYTVGRALVQLGKYANKNGNGDGRDE